MDNGIGCGEWRMMTMRLHDEHSWKCGWSQILCRHDMNTWALKPSHTVKECVLSNHVKFQHIHAQVEGIATLAPFTAQCVTSVDNGINDGLIYWKIIRDISREFWKRFHWWEWKNMTKRLHDERWWKCGWSQKFMRAQHASLALKPSHTMKACVLSNHVKFQCI